MSTIDTALMPDYTAQMESFKRSDEARESMMKDILERYEHLMNAHTILNQDYAMERDSRRRHQGRVEQLESELRGVDNNSFVLALIDGDGYIFQDLLLQAAADGGSEAASKLQQAIRDHVVSLYPDSNAGSWPIMTHIYVSLDKLGQTLHKAGILKNRYEFQAFAQAFSVNQPLFSIVDVGQGKERADYRLKEMLRTFVGNPTCKQIIFGGCHDNGYLLDLDQYKHNEAKASHITLLEAASAQRSFQSLPNFKRVRFDAVFRPQPLPDVNHYTPLAPVVQTQPPVSAPVRMKTTSPVAPFAHPPQAVTPSQSTTSPGSTAPPSIAGSNEGPVDSGWATVSKQGANGTYSIAPKQNKKKRHIYYNKDGQRLDEPLPPRDRAASEAIEQRMKGAGRNLCNNFHLNKGKCDNGKFCHFQHEPKLTPAETNALRYKTRSLACKHRDCESFECYLGHQCAIERDQGRCPYSTCNLRMSHGMDPVKYERWDEDGNQEYAPA